jgi:hypothetical protein
MSKLPILSVYPIEVVVSVSQSDFKCCNLRVKYKVEFVRLCSWTDVSV